ncbi:transporter [Aerophototrophica crusticola]|uniref:Transporter n=1 Tax=Aerophototrophica crusticola TaxID=1709002 RepID=A0A858RAZ7_9PROT|nr:transporter [Rhodospirillaceae bacterium B3]
MTRHHRSPLRPALLAATVLAGLLPATALAGGFQIRENSAAGQGLSYAGNASDPRDFSIIFNNPAAMAGLARSGGEAGVSLIMPRSDFDGSGTDALGRPLTGGTDKTTDAIPVPAAYLAFVPEGQPWRAGLAITAPYGLITEYDRDWVGRYTALYSKLETLNVNLAGSWQVTPTLSLGAGLSAQRAEAKLTNAVDFGALLASLRVPGFLPQGADGRAVVEGDDWGFGGNLGLWYQPAPSTRLGLTWRSEIEHNLEGKGRFETPANVRAVLTAANVQAFQPEGGVRADVTTPQTVEAAVSHDIGRLTLHGSVAWTDWSTFEEIRVRFDNPAQPDALDEQFWRDTWFFAVGASMKLDDPAWTLRAGVAYDETPTRDEYRTPRIADGDRVWTSVGASWAPNANLALDFGYTHLFVEDSRVDNATSLGNRISGTFENSADILSLTVRYNF